MSDQPIQAQTPKFNPIDELVFMDVNLKLKDVNFIKIARVHDWRNYVPEVLQKEWAQLTDRERRIIFVMANERASIEEWE